MSTHVNRFTNIWSKLNIICVEKWATFIEVLSSHIWLSERWSECISYDTETSIDIVICNNFRVFRRQLAFGIVSSSVLRWFVARAPTHNKREQQWNEIHEREKFWINYMIWPITISYNNIYAIDAFINHSNCIKCKTSQRLSFISQCIKVACV